MSIQEIVTKGGGILVIVLTLVQLTPIKINPWSWLAKTIGRAINSDVIKELDAVKAQQTDIQNRLEEHIVSDDRRTIDAKRRAILNFNNELCRGERHTKEAFIEVLHDIDEYEAYCKVHEDYPNNRAICAIENIKETYKRTLKKGDFLQDGRPQK